MNAARRKAFMTMTDDAVKRVKQLLARQNDPEMGIKIGVKRRGCNGLSYTMNYTKEGDKFDEVLDDKGVKLFIDSKALMVLVGTQMDYIDDELRSEFVFNNPNEKSRCGCGESFTI